MRRYVPFHSRLASQDCEDAGVWMVVRNRPNRIVILKVILARCIVSSPSDYIIGRIWTLGLINLTDIFVHNLNNN